MEERAAAPASPGSELSDPDFCEEIEEISGDTLLARKKDEEVEDIEDEVARKDNKQDTREGESEGDDVINIVDEKNSISESAGTKRKKPEPGSPSMDDPTTRDRGEGSRVQRRRLRDVVAELVKVWDSPISDPMDTPELRRRKEKKRLAILASGPGQTHFFGGKN